jgi:toll-like receptor 13
MKYNVPSFVIFPLANSIQYLDFSENILHGLTGPAGPFPNAKYLDLSKNYCSFIGIKFFDGLINLQTLQLQQNLLGLFFNTEIYEKQVFDKLVNLKSLNLSSNIISSIPRKTFSAMTALETIDLSVNNIDRWTIEVETLDNLLHLNLSTNFFQTLPKMLISKLVDNSARLNRSFSINLRNNIVKVSCDEKEFLELMVKHKNSFSFLEEYSFQDSSGSPISAAVFIKQVESFDKVCQSYILEVVLGSIGVSVFLAIIIGGFIYKNRWNIRYLMRLTKIRHFGYKRLREYTDNEDYIYDAFISYANENLRFIFDPIVPGLENRGLRLCLHDRDFLPGDNIADNIIRAIRNSKTTVIVLSADFLKSEWCLYEFNMARMESIYSRAGSNCLLVVMYEDVSDRDMPNEMLEWIRSNTYLEFTREEQGLELFWDNLYEALRG